MAYLHENKKQFMEAINLTVYQNGISFEAVEKDYYITLILRGLSQKLSYIVFKGGTSLSKCHKVIKRFSEDIDIAVDSSLSQGQKKKLKEILIEVVEGLGLKILNIEKIRSRRDYNRYEITYETVYTPQDMIVSPTILLETSFSSVSFPTVILNVGSLVGDMMQEEAPDLMEMYCLDSFKMKVQGIDRTLADKVFAVCDYYLQGKTKRHSRHIYDICKLFPLVPQNESFKSLVGEVRRVRKMSNICPSAQDGENIPALLGKIIDEGAYKEDYETITEKLLEEHLNYQMAIKTLEIISRNGMFDKEC